jgi:hypothetical protein
MFEMSQQELMMAYVEARHARVPILEMGTVERCGRFLLLSARGTHDGEPELGDAIVQALMEGEVGVAVDLAQRFLPDRPTPATGCNGNFSASGEIGAR